MNYFRNPPTKQSLPHNGDKVPLPSVKGSELTEEVRLVKIVFVSPGGQILAQSCVMRPLQEPDNLIVRRVGWS